MKHLVLILLAVSMAVVAIAESYSVTVTSTSKMIIPKRISKRKNLTPWEVSTAYAQGVMVQTTNSSPFQALWAVAGGTSAASTSLEPSVFSGETVDNTVTWRKVSEGKRKGFIIVNDGTNNVYLSVNSPAVAGEGVRLNLEGGAWTEYNLQGSVHAISGSGDANVTILEW